MRWIPWDIIVSWLLAVAGYVVGSAAVLIGWMLAVSALPYDQIGTYEPLVVLGYVLVAPFLAALLAAFGHLRPHRNRIVRNVVATCGVPVVAVGYNIVEKVWLWEDMDEVGGPGGLATISVLTLVSAVLGWMLVWVARRRGRDRTAATNPYFPLPEHKQRYLDGDPRWNQPHR
ncbi:hypothetical protein RIF23_18280 [Lipingzhangella sp. LS1_29]|uniref:Uncharacterized protein n=1 Tax=Lipingzhangella rawalii TaxID=2055835 RepID=A0ABU2HBR6_9ACTN|nr:hypothetical protein [Lipingzhangella rawalii]MDS1272240.1 hypothetical protein [Lipingzhangella rawalii]